MNDTRNGERIRLLTMVCNFETGGTEGQVLTLLKNLNPERFDLQVACLEKNGSLLQDYEALNIPVNEFKIGKLYSLATFLQIRKLARFMRDERIQIVHCYNFYALMIGIPAAKLAGVPVKLVAIRDRGVYLTRAKKFLQRFVCNMADDILVNADSIRDWLLEEGYPSDNISVIKNACDMDRYRKAPPSSIRRDFGIAKTVRIVVMIARLNRQKGVEEFIRAAGIVGQKFPDVDFLLVGKPSIESTAASKFGISEFEQWVSLIDDLTMSKRILFTGNRTDIPSILKESTISVLPSHSEGLSNVLLESMAAGVPTIASDTGGTPELVEHNRNGLLVPVQDYVALAKAMVTILDDDALAEKFSRLAVKKAEEEFSIDRMVRDTQIFYFSKIFDDLNVSVTKYSL